MPPSELTLKQAALVNAGGSMFVEACPGAGKTRAIVARFQRRIVEEPRKGIALTSFTNTAIDEVKQRCIELPDALRAPNFVGTFDSFINRFVSSPLYLRDYKRPISFIDSWDALPDSGIRIKDQPGDAFSLEWFSFDGLGKATLIDERIQGRYKTSLKKFAQAEMAKLCERAEWRRNGFVRAGLLSSSASRDLAAAWLTGDPTRRRMARLLSARFSEVIVDEAQDCGVEELTILRFLREAGVNVILVADPDQSIYEFRRARLVDFRKFVGEIPPGDRLDGNFRSTPAICSLVATLRDNTTVDKPVGGHAKLDTPVYVSSYLRASEVSSLTSELLLRHNIASADHTFLAHRAKHAIEAAGGALAKDFGVSKVARVAASSLALRNAQADTKARRDACKALERAVLGLIKDSPIDGTSIEVACERMGLSTRWLRDAAIRIALGIDPRSLDRAEYTSPVIRTWGFGVSTARLGDHGGRVGSTPRRSRSFCWSGPGLGM